jgi:hypothetical protein
MQDEKVLAALRVLAEADRERQASPEIEARLRQAFRQRRQTPPKFWTTWRHWIVTPAIAAAAVLTVVVASEWRTPKPEPVKMTLSTPAPAAIHETSREAPAVATAATPKPARRTPRVSRREIVTDFFPLVDYAPPFERGELVRVSLPASAMRTVGLPVREDRLGDRVQADVLVGQEGLARAIRFVSYSQ